jgi:hypothetical protein
MSADSRLSPRGCVIGVLFQGIQYAYECHGQVLLHCLFRDVHCKCNLSLRKTLKLLQLERTAALFRQIGDDTFQPFQFLPGVYSTIGSWFITGDE